MTLRIREGATVIGFDAPINTNVEANSAAAIALAFHKTVEGLHGEVLYARQFFEDDYSDWLDAYVLLSNGGALFEVVSEAVSAVGLSWRRKLVTLAELQQRADDNPLYEEVIEAVWPLTGRDHK